MDHKNFNVEDLASNESFIDWVRHSDPEAVKYWDLYIAQHPEIQSKVEKARALVLNLKLAEETGHDVAQVESIWAKLSDRVERETKDSAVSSSKSTWTVVLASLSLVCAAITVWLMFPATNEDRIVS